MNSPEAERDQRSEERIRRDADHQFNTVLNHLLDQNAFHIVLLDLLKDSPDLLFSLNILSAAENSVFHYRPSASSSRDVLHSFWTRL